MRLAPFIRGIALGALVLSAGCTTRREISPDRPLNETRLFVTRSGEHVSLEWDSRPDMNYTLYFNHTRSARSPWSVLPGFDHIRGTGRRLVYRDRVPVGVDRYYRLHSEPAMALSR